MFCLAFACSYSFYREVHNIDVKHPAHITCGGNDACFKELLPDEGAFPYLLRLELDECFALAAADSECANRVIYAPGNYPYLCACYLKKACCGPCSAIQAGGFQMTYEVRPTPADPTCANGVRSADNAW